MDKKAYIQQNQDWLKAKSQEEGVKEIEPGLYYKVIESGDEAGRMPKPTSMVTVNYSGTTIDGKEFDSSFGRRPLSCRLNQLIEGWVKALQKMRPGDKWEVYICADKAYGDADIPGIPGGSTLTFVIELIGVA